MLMGQCQIVLGHLHADIDQLPSEPPALEGVLRLDLRVVGFREVFREGRVHAHHGLKMLSYVSRNMPWKKEVKGAHGRWPMVLQRIPATPLLICHSRSSVHAYIMDSQ